MIQKFLALPATSSSKITLHVLLIAHFIVNNSLAISFSRGTKAARFRFLESNSWELCLGGTNILLDPVMSQLDFGIPLLYAGNKRVINGEQELEKLSKSSDFVLISQAFDDHAHKPTLKRLSKLNPNMPYLCPPAARPILESCGIASQKIDTILPGEIKRLTYGAKPIEVVATNGALLGPPWAQKENGYIIRGEGIPSLYYEPHCMYDEEELAKYQVDVVISPIVSQELPAYTLVAGGEKTLRLVNILKAKYLIPMANGNLKQTGVLSRIIRACGSEAEFQGILKRSNAPVPKVVPAPPGEYITL